MKLNNEIIYNLVHGKLLKYAWKLTCFLNDFF